MDTHQDAPAVEVLDSMPRYLLLVLACVIGALAVVIMGGPLPVSVMLGGFALWASSRVVHRPARIVLTEEGIVDRTFWYSPGFIPWGEIINIRPARWGRVDIDLRDKASFLERLPPIKKLRRYRWRLYGLGPAALNPLLLGISRRDLVETLQAGLDEYTLAEVRSHAEVARGADPMTSPLSTRRQPGAASP